MKIYIVAVDKLAYLTFKNAFRPYPNVKVVNTDFLTFMEEHPDVECIVSPGNCYAQMDGGYDDAISDYFGYGYQEEVYEYIKKNYYGEQIVGTSFILDAPKNKKFIHTPTMITPSAIVDKTIVYTAMRSTLMCAIQNNIKSIVIPPFGMGTGRVNYEDGVQLMVDAYKQIINAQNGKYYYFNKLKY